MVGAVTLSRDQAPWLVAAAFSISGVIHLVHPTTFTAIVPHVLPWAKELVEFSGVAELLCALGLWRRQRWAGVAAAVLLVVIWPANLQDAITLQGGHDLPAQVAAWVRFPLQVPLIWCALQSGRPRSLPARSPHEATAGSTPGAPPEYR
jgi:uncharacterized membrane protein